MTTLLAALSCLVMECAPAVDVGGWWRVESQGCGRGSMALLQEGAAVMGTIELCGEIYPVKGEVRGNELRLLEPIELRLTIAGRYARACGPALEAWRGPLEDEGPAVNRESFNIDDDAAVSRR